MTQEDSVTTNTRALLERVTKLEELLVRAHRLGGFCLVALLSSALIGFSLASGANSDDVLPIVRTRHLVVVDENGRDCIELQAFMGTRTFSMYGHEDLSLRESLIQSNHARIDRLKLELDAKTSESRRREIDSELEKSVREDERLRTAKLDPLMDEKKPVTRVFLSVMPSQVPRDPTAGNSQERVSLALSNVTGMECAQMSVGTTESSVELRDSGSLVSRLRMALDSGRAHFSIADKAGLVRAVAGECELTSSSSGAALTTAPTVVVFDPSGSVLFRADK